MDPIQKSDDYAVNFASYLSNVAHVQPNQRALVSEIGKNKDGRTVYTQMTFSQLDKESDCIANGFEKIGISRGTKVILISTPCLDYFSIIFALFKIGALPFIIDPKMGKRSILHCIRKIGAQVLIGTSKIHMMRFRFKKFFQTIKIKITIGNRYLCGGHSIKNIRVLPWEEYSISKPYRDEIAFVYFSAGGSTGYAKGIAYKHSLLSAQLNKMETLFNFSDNEIDLPTSPVFGCFDIALGITSVICKDSWEKNSDVNMEKVIESISNHGITNIFIPHTLLNRMSNHSCEDKINSLRRVITFGPVEYPFVFESCSSILTNNIEIFALYGETEAVPLISIKGEEIFSDTKKLTEQGFGICIGRPIEGVDFQIIKIMDKPIKELSEDLILQSGNIGEIIIKDNCLSKNYFENPKLFSDNIIKEEEKAWRRMGDLAWKDKKGRIWFCGRKRNMVVTEDGTLFTVPCESIFNNHPQVRRSGLVGIGKKYKQTPVMCIELNLDDIAGDKQKLKDELLEIAQNNPQTEGINKILFFRSFPSGVINQINIFRKTLAIWAKKQLNKES